MITVLSIQAISPSSLVLEEISVPIKNLKTRPDSWNHWIRSKAPGHTSWSMIEIDRSSGNILECYSFTRDAWIQLTPHESLIATLLTLPLKRVPLDQRKKIGPAPQPGELDTRKIWNPSAVVEGRKKDNIQFDVFETVWPQDGSALSGNTVQLYFDQDADCPLPFWIQIETTHAQLTFRAVDTGKHLKSPFRRLPRRPPQFIGHPQKTKNGLRLVLKSPLYFKHFDLFAIDVTSNERQICPIFYSLIERKNELLVLDILEEELKQVLEQDHSYKWLAIPSNHTECYAETTKPFKYADLPDIQQKSQK